MATNEMGMGEGTLKQAAQLVSGARTDFDRLSSDLEGQISGFKGKWAGAGGQAFFVLHQAWTDKQKMVVSALNEFENSLLGTERDATNVDEGQGANFTNFQNRL